MLQRKKCKCPPPLPTWLPTYADLMSLMLTFFVLLVSFSSLEAPKVVQGIQSIQEALSNAPQTRPIQVFDAPMTQPVSATDRMRTIARRIQSRMQVLGVDKDVNVKFTEKGGLKISLPSTVLFDSGRADLKAEALPLLQDVAAPLGELPEAKLEVIGFTDDRPIRAGGQFRDNWDLSYARALSVVQQMQLLGSIDIEHFEITGMGPLFPVADNSSVEGQNANRRVEILVTGDFTLPQQEQVVEMIENLEQAPTTPAPVEVQLEPVP